MRVDLEPDYHQNQWSLCDALFSNYFEDLLRGASSKDTGLLSRCLLQGR